MPWSARLAHARPALLLSLALVLVLAMQRAASGQIDPEKRRFLQFGYNQPLEGHGPLSGYALLYLNEPGFPRSGMTLRMAIAPVYLDSELGLADVFGPHTDLAVGVEGGAFADTYSEVRGGKLFREETFTGNGFGGSVSIYHLFNPSQRIPLNGVLRGGVHQSLYETDDDTDESFELPADRTTLSLRSGLRWGGVEPLLLPSLAMEVSGWYEGQFRLNHRRYGFSGDRTVERTSHLFWTRGQLAYTMPESSQRLSLALTLGTTINADRFSAYRLGGALPFSAEFPLLLPGYYFQEISAKRFALFTGTYSVPIDENARWSLAIYASTARVTYLSGLEQPGNWHTGVGGGIIYRSPSDVLQVILGYGYGVDAIRRPGRGANALWIAAQYQLAGPPPAMAPEIGAEKSRGFGRIFGSIFERLFGF